MAKTTFNITLNDGTRIQVVGTLVKLHKTEPIFGVYKLADGKEYYITHLSSGARLTCCVSNSVARKLATDLLRVEEFRTSSAPGIQAALQARGLYIPLLECLEANRYATIYRELRTFIPSLFPEQQELSLS